MNKMADKEERYPFVHVRTQLMEALRSDAKLSDASTTLKHEDDKCHFKSDTIESK